MNSDTPLLRDLLQEVSIVLGFVQPSVIINRVEINGAILEGEIMGITLKDNQKCIIRFKGRSVKGNPAPLENVSVSVNDPTLGTATLIDNESAEVIPSGLVGAFQVTVSADARIGEGENVKQGILDVTVEASEAFTIEVSADAPVDQ